jgi:PEP-CTERM motif
MNPWKRISCAAALLAGLLALAPRDADAEVIMYVYQSSSNVITSASGTIDLTDLTNPGEAGDKGEVTGNFGKIIVGSTAITLVTTYSEISGGPSQFGTGGLVLANSGSGQIFGVVDGTVLHVPLGYVSGTELSGTDTYNNTTVAGLGFTTGTYTYTWGTGVDADSFVVNNGITPSVVPVPSSLILMGSGLAGLVGYRWRRRRRAVTGGRAVLG